ncbi:ABC transporter permease subunit [Sinorhizobium medicae]|nr:ABC transporter permease subunit [Sinorhizobium medicae]
MDRQSVSGLLVVWPRRGALLRGALPVALVATIWGTFSFLAFASVLAELFAPYDPTAIDLYARLRPPIGFGGDLRHVLGTDELGRDILSRVLYAVRISLVLATAATVVGAVVGSMLGLFAAVFRGIVDQLLSLLIDAQASIPHMMIALLLIAVFGNSVPVLILVIGSYGWERYARVTRGLTLALMQKGFVAAGYTYGVNRKQLLFRHLLPNIAGSLIVTATITFPEAMLLESSLSFFGLGLQPPAASLGSMLGLGREHMLNAWWVAVVPGFALTGLALSVTFAGDGLRDHLDPHVRRA